MSAYTPGPWIAGGRHRDGTVVTGGNPEFVICTTDCGRTANMIDYSAKRAEDLANARLIAAAPMLYEGLELARDFIAAHAEGRDPGVSASDMAAYLSGALAKVPS